MTETESEAAERLRLEGNDAFATKDWERAVKLYRSSNERAEQAKTCSNLAATLCKLARYEEAQVAAERATILEPTWAKAWWRRGVVAELLKLFLEAHKFHSMAVELAPNQKAFSKAERDILKRLKATKNEDGTLTIENPCAVSAQERFIPGMIAWKRALDAVDAPDRNTNMLLNYYGAGIVQRNDPYPTSEQYLVHGYFDWVRGMKGAIAEVSTCLNPQATLPQYESLQQQRHLYATEEAFMNAHEELLGGFPDGQALGHLSSGFGHLGGMNIMFELGNGLTEPELCPQPPCLQFCPPYQYMALLHVIDGALRQVLQKLGDNDEFKCSKAVAVASTTLFANARIPFPHSFNKEQDPSPQEVVDYIKDQLRAGKTWDGGLRMYCSVQYRGAVMFAALIRVQGQLAISYQFLKWAREFITLADEEFNVSLDESYQEKGSTFRPSFRVGMMMSEQQSLNTLRGGQINGPYSVEASLDLCLDIIEMAEDMKVPTHPSDYVFQQNDVAFRRKPLALAHSVIASHLNVLQMVFDIHEFKQIVAHHGFIESIDDDCDPFHLVAEEYLMAAENELPDDAFGAVYWWGYAANMAQAGADSGYTLEMLKHAVSMAEAAEEARDVGLFGVNEERHTGTFVIVAKLTAERFKDEANSFVLPQVKLVRDGSTTQLHVYDEVICSDFTVYEKKTLELQMKKNKRYDDFLNTSKAEKQYGPEHVGVLSLETLSIRELHKAGCDFAKGETDAAVIHAKALMAESTKD